MKLRFSVNQKSALLAGKDKYGHVVVEVPVATLSEAARKLLATFSTHKDSYDKGPDADYYVDRARNVADNRRCDARSKILDALPEVTAEQVPAIMESLVAADAECDKLDAAERAGRAEKNRAATQEVLDSRKVRSDLRFAVATRASNGKVEVTESQYSSSGDPKVRSESYERLAADWFYDADEEVRKSAAAQEWLAELDRQNAERFEEAKAKAIKALETAESEAKKRAADRANWIARFGSDRLKRMVVEGIEHAAVYRDERLVLDRPGWLWKTDAVGEEREPRNPPAEAFELLDEARKIEPDARLAYWTVDRDEEDYDDDGDKYAWTGHVAIAEFLGRGIVYGVPAEYAAS